MSPQPEGDIRKEVVYLIKRLGVRAIRDFSRSLADEDITWKQISCLRMIKEENAHMPSELARFLDVDPGAITRIADRLVKLGYLRRVEGADRRSVRLDLTERGLAIVDRLTARMEEEHRRFTKGLSDGEVATLHALLGKLRDLRAQERAWDWSTV